MENSIFQQSIASLIKRRLFYLNEYGYLEGGSITILMRAI